MEIVFHFSFKISEISSGILFATALITVLHLYIREVFVEKTGTYTYWHPDSHAYAVICLCRGRQ